jgi:hypothetical protein
MSQPKELRASCNQKYAHENVLTFGFLPISCKYLPSLTLPRFSSVIFVGEASALSSGRADSREVEHGSVN